MSDGHEYRVEINVGHHVSDVEDIKNFINRQLLCEVVSRIEYDFWLWKQAQDSKQRYLEGENYRGDGNLNHNYMIAGGRGRGKSTFLHYLIHSLTGNCNPFVSDGEANESLHRYTAKAYIGEARKPLCCELLCQFDPSSPCVRRGFFLLSVLAAIQSRVEKASTVPLSMHHTKKHLLKQCEALLSDLDEGVERLSKGKPALSDLSGYQLEKLRIDNAELETQIQKNFSAVIDAVCGLCNVEAFIISIDDADTRSAQCADVLEDLRVYMRHPRLIVLLGGDRELYMERIREIHFSEYGLDYHREDEKGKLVRMDYVMSHANQYLIKLFPVENQYDLKDLSFLYEKRNPIRCSLTVKIGGLSKAYESIDLVQFLHRLFRQVISEEENEIAPYVSLFLRLPLRSMLQILNGWAQTEVWQKLQALENKNTLKGMSMADRKSARKQLRNAVKYSLRRVLLNEIHSCNESLEKIDIDDARSFFSLMLRHCQTMNDMEHGYFLSGDIGHGTEVEYVSFLLAIASGNMLLSFSDFLSCFLFGPATASLYAKSVEQFRAARNGDFAYLRREFDRYIHVRSWDSPTRWARHANMIWAYDPGFEGLHTGVLRLRHGDMIDALNDHVLRGSFEDHKEDTTKDALSLLCCMSVSMGRDTSYFISVIHYFAFILKIVKVCDRYAALNSENNDSELIAAVQRLLVSVYPVKACRAPEWQLGSYVEESFNTSRIYLPKSNKKETLRYLKDRQDLKAIAEEIVQWYREKVLLDNKKLDDDLSMHVVADLWSDLFYGMKLISHRSAEMSSFKQINSGKFQIEYGDYENKAIFLKAVNNSICYFNEVVKFVVDEFCVQEQKRCTKLSEHYLWCIHEFPLSEPLKRAAEKFANFYEKQRKQEWEKILSANSELIFPKSL